MSCSHRGSLLGCRFATKMTCLLPGRPFIILRLVIKPEGLASSAGKTDAERNGMRLIGQMKSSGGHILHSAHGRDMMLDSERIRSVHLLN